MAESSPDVIELLEAYLETAKKHPFRHVAIAMTGYPNTAAVDYAGDIALQLASREALGIITGKLQTSIDNWSLPPRDERLDASHACYNVAHGPLGFDFVVWLISREMTRLREGAPGPLRVAFWPGHNGHLTADRAMWLNKVFRPALSLLGAVEDDAAMGGRTSNNFLANDIIRAVQAGETVPRLSAPVLKPTGAVTITLREAYHDTERNSNAGAWLRFARMLRRAGERVIFIRDTLFANEELEDFETSPLASTDLIHRMSVYAAVKLNFFVANGPLALAMFSNAPWISFCDITQNSNWKVATGGLDAGQQYPWSAEDQRIVWKPDTYDNLVSAWNDRNTALAA